MKVDEWEYSDAKVKLGLYYPVVIRPPKRLENSESTFHLENRWSRLPRNGIIEDKQIHWIHNFDECHHTRASANLANPDVCVCISLVCPFVDSGGKRRKEPQLFPALFQAGTPVALWFKPHSLVNENAKQSIKQLLADGPLAELPRRIREQRQKGWGGNDENHIGRYLALLWDDPDRFPLEEPQLQEI